MNYSLQHLEQILKKLYQEADKAFSMASNSQDLYLLKSKYIGAKSPFQRMIKEVGHLKEDERPLFGQLWNKHKKKLENTYQALFRTLKEKELHKQIQEDHLDLSLPGPDYSGACTHPVRQIIQKIVSIFKPLGFHVQSGPMIETDWNNFQALNIPENHPSRDLQDTFYIDDKYVLRTQTSPIQVRALQEKKLPMAMLAPGTVFRRDSDVSHAPSFHQVEGMFVDSKVSMASLKGSLSYFVRKLFGPQTKTRFRPSFFPFTEPSAEYDCSCPVCQQKGCSLCQQTGWIEIGGCGLIHPKVFQLSHIDPEKWQGYAFGLGVERIAIVYYGIPHIRLFTENDLRFLEQFNYYSSL